MDRSLRELGDRYRSSRESLMSTMMWIGIALTVLFTLGYLFKLILVWDVSRDLYNGGGLPTMDLPLFYPIFISFGVWAILRSLNALPFPYFGLVVWISIVVLTVGLMGLFDWIGKPLRDEQLRQILATLFGVIGILVWMTDPSSVGNRAASGDRE